MTYKEKLKDPRWQKKRLEILERDNFTCCQCGDKEETLHVHHKGYIKGNEPWEYDNNYLETLCETCHFVAESYGKTLPDEEYPLYTKKVYDVLTKRRYIVGISYSEGTNIKILDVDMASKAIHEITIPIGDIETIIASSSVENLPF